MTIISTTKKNLGTAKLTKYRVKNMLDYYAIKSIYSNQIFARKEDDGHYYILADREQFTHITKSGFTLTEVPNILQNEK